MKVEEVCSCGAGLTIESNGATNDAMRHLRLWRQAHQHAAPTSRTRAIGFPMPGLPDDDFDNRKAQ